LKYTIELLEAEIDILKDNYKSTKDDVLRTEYSKRVLDLKICLKILKQANEANSENGKLPIEELSDGVAVCPACKIYENNKAYSCCPFCAKRFDRQTDC
jgi:hypothetical protein